MGKRRCKAGDPALAIAYCRASTSEQYLSPEAQRAHIERWALQRDVRVGNWHVDQGVSGGSEMEDRPALTAAMAELRSTGAGVLIIARRDRLARDVAVAATIERAVRASGAFVVSADGNGNGDGDADVFLRRLLDAAAEYERRLIRSRTRAALAAKRARGQRSGEVPFGYAADQAGRLVPNPTAQKVVDHVRAWRAAGMSLRAIVAACAQTGYLSRAGRPLGKTQIERIVMRAA